MTMMSGISITPAFSAWIESPEPGISTSTIVSAWSMMSISAWPTPTVSTNTSSRPAASSSSAACNAASESPPSAPRLAIERMNTPGSRKCSPRRMRSPSSAPCVNGEDGSIDSTPTVRPTSRRAFVSAPISVDLPTPGGPGEAHDGGAAGMRIDLAHELPALRTVVLDERDRTRQRATVAGEQALGEVVASVIARAIIAGQRFAEPSGHSAGPSRRAGVGPTRLAPNPYDPTRWSRARRARRPGAPRGHRRRRLRRAPAPLHGGPLTLLRFMRANNMLNRHYARLLARYALLKLRYGRRLQTDGICFICPGVHLEIGRGRNAADRSLGVDRRRQQDPRARGRSQRSVPRP